jgi:pyruvate formate lyase activating enzyme
VSSPSGRIFDIQRFSTHDGPGIRTTVFFKGCPLRCPWCHNPDGISPERQISLLAEKCIACGACVRACPHEAHRLQEAPSWSAAVSAAGGGQDARAPAQDHRVHGLDRQRCEVCGACAAVCDAGALEMVGRDVTVEEVMQEVLPDRPFYTGSGGGLTLSGGEPLLQIDFAAALLRAAKDQGLHCCLETCGFADWRQIERIRPLVDLFLYDYKETDPRRHAELTGQSNDIILENLRALYRHGASIRLQCPVVPGYNDSEAHFRGIAALAREMPRLQGIKLLPYHPLGNSKLQRFGLARQIQANPPDRAALATWIAWFDKQGVRLLNRRACVAGRGRPVS